MYSMSSPTVPMAYMRIELRMVMPKMKLSGALNVSLSVLVNVSCS